MIGKPEAKAVGTSRGRSSGQLAIHKLSSSCTLALSLVVDSFPMLHTTSWKLKRSPQDTRSSPMRPPQQGLKLRAPSYAGP